MRAEDVRAEGVRAEDVRAEDVRKTELLSTSDFEKRFTFALRKCRCGEYAA